MKRPESCVKGFTVLELLISLSMLVVLVAACLTAVRLATASREAATQAADRDQRLRVLHERLSSTLRSAHLFWVPFESQSLLPEEKDKDMAVPQVLAFEGGPESLKFVTFSDPLMGPPTGPAPWIHQVNFYLEKNEDTGLLELLMNEREFSTEAFFNNGLQGFERGRTLRIVQDLAYLKFRYYTQMLDPGKPAEPTGDKSVKSEGEWTDKILAKPIDFKSNIVENKNTSNNDHSFNLPRAVEVSVGLWDADRPMADGRPQMVELPPILILLQEGMVFERVEEEGETGVASE